MSTTPATLTIGIPIYPGVDPVLSQPAREEQAEAREGLARLIRPVLARLAS